MNEIINQNKEYAKLALLIISGSVEDLPDNPKSARKISRDHLDEAILLLKKFSSSDPDFVLKEQETAIKEGQFCMSPITIPILLAKSSKDWLRSKEIKHKIIDILIQLEVIDLLDLTMIIKQKTFGKGLGSFEQKLLKTSIEEWSIEKLKRSLYCNKGDTLKLFSLLHPKFSGRKNELIQTLD